MAITIGSAIYVSVKPIFKMFLTGGAGAVLARTGILDLSTSQHISQLVVNFFLPCLVFNKFLQAFDDSTMNIAGIIALTAVVYLACGLLFGMIVRWFTPNPRNWRGGVLVAGIFSNCSDLPMAYISTLAQGPPFTTADIDKGLAYSSVFLAVLTIGIFNFGGSYLLQRDFDNKKRVELHTGDVVPTSRTYKGSLRKFHEVAVSTMSKAHHVCHFHQHHSSESSSQKSDIERQDKVKVNPADSNGTLTSRNGHSTNQTLDEPPPDFLDTTREDEVGYQLCPQLSADDGLPETRLSRFVTNHSSRIGLKEHHTRKISHLIRRAYQTLWVRRVLLFFHSFLRPAPLALITGIVFAVIPPIKRLFVVTDYPIENAPDNMPVLSVFMDTTSFIGAATVPCGLMMLGAVISRLKINKLPSGFWQSIVVMALLKMVVLPIIAVAWVERLMAIGWIDRDQLVLIFVLIVSSGVPSATVQVYLTSAFAPIDEDILHVEMDCLAAHLITQYCLIFITLPILVTYTLKIVVDQ